MRPAHLRPNQCNVQNAHPTACTNFREGPLGALPNGQGVKAFGVTMESGGVWRQGFGCRGVGFEFRVSGFGFRVSGFEFQGLISGIGFGVSGFEGRVSGVPLNQAAYGASLLTQEREILRVSTPES